MVYLAELFQKTSHLEPCNATESSLPWPRLDFLHDDWLIGLMGLDNYGRKGPARLGRACLSPDVLIDPNTVLMMSQESHSPQ